jgi:succinoglycan biosynthesis protein ExoV
MHGAIAADALRIPWIPIITSPRMLTFKWQDWCSSLGLKYKPYYILPLGKFYPPSARGLRSSIRYGHYCLNWLSQSSLNSLPQLLRTKQDSAATQLEHIAYDVTPNLSSDSRIEQLTIALEKKLDQLKTDLGYVI